MKNKLLALGLAVVIGAFSIPAQATLTNSSTAAQHGNVLFYSALITAASNDTTDPADSNVISNLDGSIKDICVGVKATNQTGTNPTLQLKLLGSFDNSVFHVMTTAQDDDDPGVVADVDAGSTLNIATASTTNVSQGFCGSDFGLENYPPYVKVRVDVGGTGTPGWTGVAYATVER